jgi:membrane-bound lytic murein transglycosylase MltF
MFLHRLHGTLGCGSAGEPGSRIALKHAPARSMLVLVACLAQGGLAATNTSSGHQATWVQPLLEDRWTADLDTMVERRRIRVLVVPGATSYFIDRGVQRGISYELLRLFEEELNARLHEQKKLPVVMIFVTVPRDELILALATGRGDIAAVAGPTDDLSRANALPGISVQPDLLTTCGSPLALMFRQSNRQLKGAIDAFLERHPAREPARATIFRKYLNSAKVVASKHDLRRFQATIALFKKYGAAYAIDYQLMIALAYQESHFDQRARSREGAVGIMQVMPATARRMHAGDITRVDDNIKAGIRYVTQVRARYFANEPMDELNRDLFTFAAYNAGPARINGLRKLAARRGLDPNVWFDNVELVALEQVGREPVTYVGNILRYYVAYVAYALELETETRGPSRSLVATRKEVHASAAR